MECKKETDLCRIEWCDRPIVRVLGTVMTRDDTLGGWVPYMNGGQSKVGIHESMDGMRYRIYGWRVNDKKVTLDCYIQRHMVFHETIGTFHHWKIGEKKMGLTFYTPAEARSFNRGVRVALEKLARVPEYTSSSASSTCSRLSDDHQSSCTSPASSTGSSSSCCMAMGSLPKHKHGHDSNKVSSTSSTSSSSSRHAPRHRRSPGTKSGRSHRATHNSTSSSASTQMNRPLNNGATPAVTAAPTLSLLSATTSPRFCDTPSSSDLGQHFRWPLPQQQSFSTTLSFLNRPLPKDGSPYELSALALPSPHSASSTIARDTDAGNSTKTQTSLPRNEELDLKDCVSKTPQETTPPQTLTRESTTHSRHTEGRHISSPSRRGDDHLHTTRTRSYRHTKTPYLDILERQRDLKPTEPNSYVLFSSPKPATALGSQRVTSRNLTTGMTTSLSAMQGADYKPLGHMSLVDGYQYHPLLSTICSERPYQHPQTGTLSIMATANDGRRYFNRTDIFHTSNIDTIKDDAILYEPRRSLLSTPKKSTKLKDFGYYGESFSDDEVRRNSDCALGCCPCRNHLRLGHRRSTSGGRYKEDLAERSKCRYCHEMFNHERNRPGACRHAPDKCLKSIERVTCLFCADSLFYHCCRDDEGDYDDEPCTCSNVHGGGRSRFWRRWGTLAALSVILPCLCLYPPLRACHSCGVACHCCGGKHQPTFPSKNSDKQSREKR